MSLANATHFLSFLILDEQCVFESARQEYKTLDFSLKCPLTLDETIFHGFLRSWLSCWKRRSWAGFLCWYLQTSRTCWRLHQPPRSQRVSTCTPSATASGRSSRALPSQGRASRCVSSKCSHPSLSRPGFYVWPSQVEVKRVHHINCAAFCQSCHNSCCVFSFFRRAWIGSAKASTPRRSSSVSSLLILRRKNHTHTKHLSYYDGVLQWNVPLIHQGPDVFNTKLCLGYKLIVYNQSQQNLSVVTSKWN